MGSGVKEGHSLAFQVPLSFYLAPEGLIGVFQVGEGSIQPPG